MAEFMGEVHARADDFPMLSEEELRGLADDIAENGLRDPIVLTPEGVLLDGRNRLAACELAGVEPTFVVESGNPVAFIRSKNIKRRHQSPGAVAMGEAVLMWDEGKWDHTAGRWRYGAKSIVANATIQRQALAMSGVVLAESRALALEVLAGTRNLRKTYEEIKDTQRRREERARQLADLATLAPDLHTLVAEETLPLDEAVAAYNKRTEEERAAAQKDAAWRRKLRDGLRDAVLEADTTSHKNNIDALLRGLAENPTEDCTPQRLREAATQLGAIADTIERNKK